MKNYLITLINEQLFSIFKPFISFIVRVYSPSIYISGMLITPQQFAIRLMITILIAIAISSISIFLAPSFPLAFIGIISISIPIIYSIIPFLEINRRRINCERELPFVTTFLTIASASSLSLSSAILNLSKIHHLKAFAKEAMRIEKVRRLYAISPSDAVIFEAKNHPSESVKSILLTAMMAQKLGESQFLIMRDEMIKAFTILLSKLKVLSDKFSLLASAQMIIFIIIPMAMITIGVMFSGILTPLSLFFICIILPSIFVPLMSYLIDSYYPKELTEPVNLMPFLASLFFAPLTIIAYKLFYINSNSLISFHNILSLIIIIFTIPSAIWYSLKRRETRQVLEALPIFTRSMAEEVKKGLSPSQALQLLSKSFNLTFNKILINIVAHVRSGARIGEATSTIKMPWIAHVYFELLDYAEQVGADPKSMNALSELVNNIHTSMKSLHSQTSLFKASCIINSIILPFSIAMVIEVVVKLFANVSKMLISIPLPMGLSLLTLDLLSLVELIAYSGVILNAYFLGILGGKVSGGGSIVDGLSMALLCIILAEFTLILLVDFGTIASLFDW
ncbi:MAG: type II secretion system F family protein [Nitrososphaerota archaeon]|nr:type II secretion system F family protein [Nitrososphaerota archaeon]